VVSSNHAKAIRSRPSSPAVRHSCALGDPEAKALMTAISNNDLAAKRDHKAEPPPVLVLRPPMPFFYRHWLNKPGMVPIPSPRDPREPIGT
jgi:hypothetical protein